MASAFENLAPRVITDLMRELGVTAAQAAGIVGNLAAESGLLAIQEGHPLAGRGGFGWAQWTGPRRVAFEAWCIAHNLNKESYEANFGYLVQELKKPPHDRSLRQLKRTSTAKAAAETFGYWFERFAGYQNLGSANYKKRVQFAERALQLYQAKQPTPVPPVCHPSEPATMPTPTVTVVPAARTAIPWFKSLVFTGASGGLGASLYAIFSAYLPGVPILNQVDTLAPPVIAAIATAIALIGRVTSTAQPLTTSQSAADLHAEAQVAAQAAIPVAPVQEAWAPSVAQEPEEDRPLREVSLQKLADEMPDVIQLLGGLATAIHQIQGVASKIGERPPNG
jgi:hypothetical protein